MPETTARSTFRVEGSDDLNSILHLLLRNGLRFDIKPLPDELPVFENAKSVEKLLAGMELAIKFGKDLTIGFLLDADSHLDRRWQAVRERLLAAGVTNVPRLAPASGFIGESPKFKSRVGVWIMPDNQQDGKLEDFLRKLIADGNALIVHAETSTDKAIELGASFNNIDRIKAVIHAWLAWQETPGLPYGTAMRAKYFQHDTANARSFVDWFKKLYNLN